MRDRTARISAGEFPDLCKLFAEDLTTCATMPSEGGHGRQGKSESLIKAVNIATSQITLITEIFKDATITSNHDFSKIPWEDLEFLYDLFEKPKKKIKKNYARGDMTTK